MTGPVPDNTTRPGYEADIALIRGWLQWHPAGKVVESDALSALDRIARAVVARAAGTEE